MRFDSHLLAVVNAAVGLVNGLTGGQSGGRVVDAPTGAARQALIREVLGGSKSRPFGITATEAESLSGVAAALRRVFENVDSGDLASAARVVNDLLRESGARPQLDHDRTDGWSVHFHGSDDTVVTGWTAGCATGMALAIGTDLAGRLGVCAAESCDRVYVDASRNAAKRFCSTACQNRTKAAAFRARSRERE
jgi:predicted RNA-binding Zn ribbon-like protein